MKLFPVVVLAVLVAVASASNDPFEKSNRIVNGHTVRDGDVPYIVSLLITRKSTQYLCGGSIVSSRWVLTAAHCTDGAQTIRIFYGSTGIRKGSLIHTVSGNHVIQHRDYDAKTYLNDIALIRTPSIQYTNLINSTALADGTISYDKELGLACGWGDTQTGQNQPEELQCVQLQIISNAECAQSYRDIRDSQLCANTFDGDTCSGDSGGPLVVGNRLVGITSYGPVPCANGDKAVFTRVSAHLDWIRNSAGM